MSSIPSQRPLWTAVFLLAATVVAALTAVLAHAGGANLPTAVLTAGAAFAGAVGLLLGLAHFLGPR